jgi:small-conductance mechanosensitive channel
MAAVISRLLVFVLAAMLVSGPVAAQGLGKSGSSIVDNQRTVIQGLTFRTDELEKKIVSGEDDDQRLVEIKLQLDEVARELLAASVSFRPRLTEINARLEQLGPAPPEGAPEEPDIVAAERDQLNAEKAEINAAIGVAEDLSIRVNALINRIAEIRRDLFSRLLTKRYDINLTLGGEVLAAAQQETTALYRTVSSWLRFVVNFKLSSVLGATFMALIAAAVLLIGGRRSIGHLIVADPGVTDPSSLSRLSVAFWSTLLPSAALGVFLGSTYFFFDYFNVLRGDIGTMLAALFSMIGLVFFVHRLGRAVLLPRLPEWRLIPVTSHAASSLLWIMSAMAAVSAIDFFLTIVYGVQNSPLTLTVVEALIATVVIGLLVIAAGVLKPLADAEGRPRRWPAVVRFGLYLLGGLTILAALLGYVGMARFISQQIVWTGAVLVTMYIGFLSSRAVSEEGAFGGTALGQRFQRWFHLEVPALDQLGLFFSIVINILVVAAGVPLILLQWGFQTGDINAWLIRIATGIQIGGFTLSLTGIFWGIVVFVVGYLLTRWFQGWLDGSVMARGRVEPGVRNSIRTVVGYAGLALAGLIGLSAAGIDFSNLALIAGGLSLGIGFGLQNIVQNFVSGLILLAERPFKSGDWIVAGPISGTVKKISVRATEIETFQRQTVILPNSELINSAVGNWTHRNKMGRVDIPVSVALGTDPRIIHALLLKIATEHPMVLNNPEPFVLFSAFGEFSLNFEVRVFLADVNNGSIVQNDIRFAIVDAFEREGISLPLRHSDVHARQTSDLPQWPVDDDRAEAELVEEVHARAAEAKARPRRNRRRSRRRRQRRPDPG